MDEESKQLLRENLEITRDNSRQLRKIRHSMFLSNVLRFVWWVVIIGGPIVFYYYFLAPYVGQFQATYQGLEQGVEGLSGIGTGLPEGFGNIIDKFRPDASVE